MWRARAHLTLPALSLLPKLLLQLFIQSAHLPLVFTLPPPKCLLQTVALPGRRLQAGGCAHQNFL